MSAGTTITPLATYRNQTPYPFCPGCGHGPILDHLNAALVKLQHDPRQVVIVSDIGCSGLSDQYFGTSAFHGLHGRSITYATGIKLARPELTVIVVMGDGGTGIGGAHLLSAARRSIGMTVLVFNHMNFGMTGGQHSTTTPTGAFTATTPGGNLERPLDVCATASVNGAGFVYRGTSFDANLADRIADGIRHSGCAVLDIWEPCTVNVAAASTADMTDWGEYVGNRYKDYGNIIWLIGGDQDPTDYMTKLNAFMTGLQTYASQLVTIHNSRNSEAFTYQQPTWLSLNNIYTLMANTNTWADDAWARSPTIPFFQIEATYEDDGYASTDQEVRAQSYWTILGGGLAGAVYGHNLMYYFTTGWDDYLGLEGSVGMHHLSHLFNAVAWQTLVPDWAHTFLT